VEKHFDDRKPASPPKPPTPHHHHRIDPKEAEHHNESLIKEEEWERAGDPDYKADDKFDRAERKGLSPISRKQIQGFRQQQKREEQEALAQGIKGMPELYVNYPDPPNPPRGLSTKEQLEYLAQPSGQRPETPGDKIPRIPVDTKRTFDRGLGTRAFGPKETKDDYPKTLEEWKLTNINNAISKLVKLVKEGDGDGGIDGLSGVVFTSENAGVFTPTHGGHHTTAKKRRHIKREHDKKRRELLGKQKKNGVARLEQFIREGSPVTKAVQDLPLQRMKNMSGRAGTEYAPTHESGNRMQLDYKKEGEKRTMGEDLQPNSSLQGLNSSIEQARQMTETQGEDISVAKQPIPKKYEWSDNNTVQDVELRKYSPGNVTSMGSQPDQNPDSNPPKYIERGKSSGTKNKQQDVQMNDVTNKVKKLQDEDADIEQPAGAVSMAVREVNKQVSPWGSYGSVDRDEIKRGGDLDEIEDDEDKKESEPSESELVVEAIKRLQERKQKHLDKGADDALFLAMMEDVDAV